MANEPGYDGKENPDPDPSPNSEPEPNPNQVRRQGELGAEQGVQRQAAPLHDAARHDGRAPLAARRLRGRRAGALCGAARPRAAAVLG
eukprot:scaffold31170_cov96-Phaeocystis_antarctica.AAC.1